MSGTLYDQQTRNSLTALADIVGSFEDFMAEAIRKDASNIRQYYSPRRIEASPDCIPDLLPTCARRATSFAGSGLRLAAAQYVI